MKTVTKISLLFIIGFVLITSTINSKQLAFLDSRLEHIFFNYKNNDPGDAYSVHRFAATAGENLEVHTSGGKISVKGADVDEVEVRMYVKRSGRTLKPSDTDLSNFDIEITKRGNTIIASARRQQVRNTILSRNNESISFEVLIPDNFNINVNTSGGSIKLDEITGNLVARTSGGSISLNNLGGMVDVRTSGGSITIAESGGTISARTSGGSISVKTTAGDLELRTSGGSISLDDITGKVDASTSGGSIRAKILKLDGDVSLRTSGGTVTASVPAGIGLDLDLSGNSVNVPLQNFTGETRRNRVSGSMNGGGHKVTMRTSGGSVNLNWN